MQTNISKKMAMLFLTTAMTLGSGAVLAAPGTGSNAGGSDGGVPELQNNAPNSVDNKDINNSSTNTNTTGTTTGTDACCLNKTEQHKNTMCKDGRCPDVNKKVETGTTGIGSPDGTKTDGIAKKLNYGYTYFMSYSIDFRRRILSIKKHEGLSIRETAKRFHIGTTTIVRWTKQIDARPATSRQRKIDKSALERDVEQYPDAYQRERAERFGVCQMAICKALKKLQLTYKKNSASSKSRRRR